MVISFTNLVFIGTNMVPEQYVHLWKFNGKDKTNNILIYLYG